MRLLYPFLFFFATTSSLFLKSVAFLLDLIGSILYLTFTAIGKMSEHLDVLAEEQSDFAASLLDEE